MRRHPTAAAADKLSVFHPHDVTLPINLPGYAAAQKQLALIFGFDVSTAGRVLVYTNAGLLKDQHLAYGDNQFLLEIESLDLPFFLFFIQAGGEWFFRGLSGYVV